FLFISKSIRSRSLSPSFFLLSLAVNSTWPNPRVEIRRKNDNMPNFSFIYQYFSLGFLGAFFALRSCLFFCVLRSKFRAARNRFSACSLDNSPFLGAALPLFSFLGWFCRC